MKILIFSAFLLIVTLLIKYFSFSNSRQGLKLLSIFGILIGFSALGLNSLFNSNFGASTPINLRIENLTNKQLKVYSIAFWNNSWNEKGNYVTYGGKIEPKETTDFDFENDGTTEFWIVAKDKNGDIEYLNRITDSTSEFEIKILKNSNTYQQGNEMAQHLTFKKDKQIESNNYVIWANIILIGILAVTFIRIKTGANTGYKP